MSGSAWTPVDENQGQNSAWKPVEEKTTPAKTEEPGFLDKDIPLSGSALNPTLSGIQSIGRGFRSAYRGIADTLDPHVHEGEEGIGSNAVPGVIARPIARLGKGIYDTAKDIPEIPGAIHDIDASPDPLTQSSLHTAALAGADLTIEDYRLIN